MAHRLGGGGKEMGAILERAVLPAGQAQPHLMNEGGGLKRMTRRSARHFICGKLAQIRIDQRQQVIGGPRFATLNILKNAGHVAQQGTITRYSDLAPDYYKLQEKQGAH